MSSFFGIKYNASRTAARFHGSKAFVRGIRGPIGSGKSVACVLEMFKIAMEMPASNDGWKRSRWAAIRNTYPELESTTIRTFQDWFPDNVAPINWGAPITAVLKIPQLKVEMEVIFLAVDRPKDVKKLKSLELTGLWINEASELPKAVLDMATGRVGRFPAKKDCPTKYRSCVIMDTNPPDTDHWWYTLAEKERPKDWEFFSQPPALIKRANPDKSKAAHYVPNPAAENIENHPEGFNYYLRQLGGKTEEWIKVFILGEYGSVMDGKPVYSEYSDAMHCADEVIEPMRGIPLILGWDYGRTPALAICQLTPNGQFRVIDEVVVDATGDGMGIRTFTRQVVKPYLASEYTGMTLISRGDPAGASKDSSELDHFQIQAEEGIPTEGAPTNDPSARQDAVRRFLLSQVDGGPGFLCSPKATLIRKGFLGGYKFERVQVTGEERYKEQPAKNRYSHPHDGLQYAALEAVGGNVVIVPARKRDVVRRSAQGWT